MSGSSGMRIQDSAFPGRSPTRHRAIRKCGDGGNTLLHLADFALLQNASVTCKVQFSL
jgi:hypothetical protein